MDLNAIAEVIGLPIDNETKEHYILALIAKDKKAIPKILAMLDSERTERTKVLLDCNALLSKTHLAMLRPDINEGNFIHHEIMDFHNTNGIVGHCMANMDKAGEKFEKENNITPIKREKFENYG